MAWRFSRRLSSYPVAPLVFTERRPPKRLTEAQATAIASHARPLGELHALFYESVDVDAAHAPRRGPYHRKPLLPPPRSAAGDAKQFDDAEQQHSDAGRRTADQGQNRADERGQQ